VYSVSPRALTSAGTGVCDSPAVDVTIADRAAPATAAMIMRWKPSARSRSLRGISALSAQPARIEPAQRLGSLRSPRARLALPVRQGFCLWNRLPSVPRRDGLCDIFCPWRTERARAGGGERSERSRLSGPYSSECGAVRLFEREYPAWFERPWLSRHPENLRFSETATASGPRAFNAHRRVRCGL